MKTKFEQIASNRVAMTIETQFDGIQTREFYCGRDGGYINETTSNGDSRQVCERLAWMGNTLSVRDPANLINVIRREYRAMRRAEKR